MIKAVLFDMDGVLIDSEHTIRACSIDAFKTLGINATHEDFMEFTGMSENGFFGGVLRKYGREFTEEIQDLCYDFYEKNSPKYSKVDPSVKEMLLRLRKNGYKIAVASSAIKRKVLINLSCLSMTEDDFDAVITGSDIKHKKPHPEIFLTASERLEIPPEECIVVEDAVNGIIAARGANMDCIGITGTFTYEKLIENGADYAVDNVTEIEHLLNIM